jgi:hypothetical protein
LSLKSDPKKADETADKRVSADARPSAPSATGRDRTKIRKALKEKREQADAIVRFFGRTITRPLPPFLRTGQRGRTDKTEWTA